MKKPGVLVLGATGRIGTILRTCWPSDGIKWQARRPQPEPGWYILDLLTEPGLLARAAEGCGTILCLVGVVPGRGGDLRDNARMAEVAIRAAAESGARVFLASSAAVYGAQSGQLNEDALTMPIAEYGRAKAEMEQRGADLAEKLDVSVTSLRIGNVAGCDAILGGWRSGFELDRFTDGTTPRRSYIGPVTLARVLLDLAHVPNLPPVLNVAAPGMVEMGALLDAAGLVWIPRPAQGNAIPEVHLSTARLAAFTSFDAADSSPQTLVQQWQEVFA